MLAYQVGDNDQAVEYIGRALSLHPEFPEADSNLGLALMAQGKLADAVASFQQAVRPKPDFCGGSIKPGQRLERSGENRGGDQPL